MPLDCVCDPVGENLQASQRQRDYLDAFSGISDHTSIHHVHHYDDPHTNSLNRVEMITKQVFKTREEWLEYRNSTFMIGGSNLAAILGLDPHRSPLDVWQEWQDRKEAPMRPDMYRGRFMEEGISRWFEQQTGLKVIKRSAEISVFHNDKYPEYVQAAPDREVFARGSALKSRGVLEIKDTRRSIDPENLPDEWYIQVLAQTEICGFAGGYLAVCDGKKELIHRLITADPERIEPLIRHACEWVEAHIIRGEQPKPINKKDVQSIFPESQPAAAQVTPITKELVEVAKATRAAIQDLESKYTDIVDLLAVTFGENDTLEFESVPIATYRTVHTSRVDTDRLFEDHPELKDKYLITNSYRKLNFK